MKGGDMCDGLEGHIVVFNWNNKGPGILKALLKAEAQKREIVVITDNPKFCCPPEAKDLIREIRVDTGSEESFTQGRVAYANSIIILGDGCAEPDSADANNLLLVLALKKMLRESHAVQVPIIVEMSDPRKAKLSEYLTVPNEAPVEVISAQHLAGELIVQAAVNPGLTRIYEDLLTFGSGTNEVYRWIVRGSLVGKSIVEMYERCTALRIQGVDLLPIAIERDGVLHLNPSSKECGAIQCNDVLYAICDRADIIRKLDA
jgi:Trk K+ transport system NAD-binding subunit